MATESNKMEGGVREGRVHVLKYLTEAKSVFESKEDVDLFNFLSIGIIDDLHLIEWKEYWSGLQGRITHG